MNRELPPPVGGLNHRDSDDLMEPTDAKTLDNWIPDAGFCRVREGQAAGGAGGAEIDFTDPFSGVRCDALDLALQAYDHYWPLDDPERGATVPTEFYRSTGGTLALAPVSGAGNAWNTGIHDSVDTALEDLGDFNLCSDIETYRHAFSLDQTRYVEFTGWSGDVRGFYQTFVVIDDGTTFSGTMDVRNRWLVPQPFGASYTEQNPRVGVSINFATKTATFTGALSGDSPSTSIVYDNDSKVHVVTVYFPAPDPVNTGNNGSGFPEWRVEYDYSLYVDGEAVDTLSQNSTKSATSVGAEMSFDSTLWWRAFRGGAGTWLGLGYSPTINRHEAIWAAIQANR